MATSKQIAEQNIRTLERINRTASNDLKNILNLGSAYDRNEFGGLVRSTIPPLLEKYTNISAQLAASHYNEMRAAAISSSANLGLSRSATRRREAAIVRDTIKVSAGAYTAKIPDFNLMEKNEKIIGYVMQTFANGGFEPAKNQSLLATVREIAMSNRDTILFNATLDSSIRRVQRVADPNACAFCLTLALNDAAGYAVDFHNDCKCTIEPIFEGQSEIRPDYYDDLEAKYNAGVEAREEAGQKGAKATFAAIRAVTGAK